MTVPTEGVRINAVGTVGACTVGGVLVQIAQSDWFNAMVKGLFEKIPTLGLF